MYLYMLYNDLQCKVDSKTLQMNHLSMPEYNNTRKNGCWQNKLAIHDCSLLCLPAWCQVIDEGSCQLDISSAFLLEVMCFITPTHNF